MALSGGGGSNLVITVRADAAKLRGDLALAQAQVRALGTELRAAANESLKTGDMSGVRALSDAFEKARGTVAKLRGEISANIAPTLSLAGHFADAGTRLGTFGNALSAITPRFTALAAGLIAAGAAFGVFRAAKSAAIATGEIIDTSENLKISTEELLALRQFSERTGADAKVIESAMQKGNRTLGEAVAKTKDFQTAIEGQVTALRGSATALDQSSGAVETLRGGQRALKDEMQGTVNVLRGSGGLAEVANEYAVIARLAGTTIQALVKMSPIDRFLAEAKAIGRVKDETEQARLANAAWGKSYKDMLPFLRDAETKLRPAIARVREFEQGVSKAEHAVSDKFLEALARLNTAIAQLARFVGGALGTVFVPVFQEVELAIVANKKAIEEFATAMAAQAMPVVQDLLALLRHAGDASKAELKTDFVKGLVTAFDAVKVAAKIAIAVIRDGFELLSNVLDPVAALINSMFGTKLTGDTLALGAAVLYATGAFNALALAVNLVVAAVLLFGGLPIAVGVALALVVASVWKNRDLIAGTFQGLWDIITGLWMIGTDNLKLGIDTLGQKFTDFGVWVADVFKTYVVQSIETAIFWVNYLIGLAKQALDAVGLLPGAGSSSESNQPLGLAGGGRVPGRGIGDTVRAMLTPGEFVQRVAAVRYYGVDFMRRLNALQIPRFEMGGIVDSLRDGLGMPTQRFAMGGMVASLGAAGGGSMDRVAVDLTWNGASFAMIAPRQVAEKFGEHARRQKMLSAIKKPSSYR